MGTVHHAPACSVASTTVPIQEPQPACFCKCLARPLVQRRFVDLTAKTKREFGRFDFLRIAQLHFDRYRADHRQPVAVINDALHMLDEELPLVVKDGAVLEAGEGNFAELPDAQLDAFLVQ